MYKNKLEWRAMLGCMAAILFLSACIDGPGNTGLEVLPPDDRLVTAFTDTQQIVMQSIIVDSVDTYRSERQLVGNYVDPEFGRISATTFTQVLARSGLIFADSASNLIFDSLVLQLVFDGGYGNIETPQTLRVHPLTDSFPAVEDISSLTEIPYDQNLDLANGRQISFDQTIIRTVNIRLDDDLGRKILFTDPDTLSDRDLLASILPGFRISTDPVQFFSREPGAIFSINSVDENTRLLLYYQERDSATAVFEAKTEPFLIVGVTPRFSNIKRSDLNGDRLIDKYLPQPDDNDEYEFLQAGALIKNLIRFPDITDLQGVAIQRAELILHVDETWLGSDKRFLPPNSLNVALADEDGNELLTDGGITLVANAPNYDEEEGIYSIILTNYVQQLVSGQSANNGIIILPGLLNISVDRVVLGGTNHPSLAPELKITYTSLPR